MVKPWQVAAGVGGATALGLATAKLVGAWPFAPGPAVGKYRLTVKSTPVVGVDVTVDGQTLTTDNHLDLDPGTYAITAPDSVQDAAGNVYTYVGSE